MTSFNIMLRLVLEAEASSLGIELNFLDLTEIPWEWVPDFHLRRKYWHFNLHNFVFDLAV